MDLTRMLKSQLLILGYELGAEGTATIKKAMIIEAIEALDLDSEDKEDAWKEMPERKEREEKYEEREQKLEERRLENPRKQK